MTNLIYENWLTNVKEAERAELSSLKDNAIEIKERFAMELAFGTAGMRGEVGLGTYRMNTYTVRRAAAGLAQYISSLGDMGKNQGVVIAYDTRRFSREFAIAVAEVMGGYQIKTYIFEDVRPVPICSFAIRELNAVAGVMITASHNPKEYNGFKVYGADGAQMSPEPTAKVVSYIQKITDYFTHDKLDLQSYNFKGLDNYYLNDYVKVIGQEIDEKYYSTIEKLSLSPNIIKKYGKDIKLVYTPIHGTGYIPVTTIFNRLGITASVVAEQSMPDTEFSTVESPNPENADALTMGIELGNNIGADVVLATDPDCDRLGVAVRNNKGDFVLLSGNQIATLLLDYICVRLTEDNKMPNNPAIVKTIVTSTLADRLAESYGVTVYNVLTGFKYIGEKIKEWERTDEHTYIFGFEESYGSLMGTHARDKDAVVASMLFAEMMIYLASKGKTVYGRLMDIFDTFGYYIEKNIAITYKGLSGMSDMARVMSNLRSKKLDKLGDESIRYTADYLSSIKTYSDGRQEKLDFPVSDVVYLALSDGQFVCIRPSGTEPKLKIYVLVYDATEQTAQLKADIIFNEIEKELA